MLEDFYIHTATIYNQGYVANQINEDVETRTSVATGVACRLVEESTDIEIFQGNIASHLKVKVYIDIPVGFNLKEWDYIYVNEVSQLYKIEDHHIAYDMDGPHHVELDVYKHVRN
jgi:hypothetical protein